MRKVYCSIPNGMSTFQRCSATAWRAKHWSAHLSGKRQHDLLYKRSPCLSEKNPFIFELLDAKKQALLLGCDAQTNIAALVFLPAYGAIVFEFLSSDNLQELLVIAAWIDLKILLHGTDKVQLIIIVQSGGPIWSQVSITRIKSFFPKRKMTGRE